MGVVGELGGIALEGDVGVAGVEETAVVVSGTECEQYLRTVVLGAMEDIAFSGFQHVTVEHIFPCLARKCGTVLTRVATYYPERILINLNLADLHVKRQTDEVPTVSVKCEGDFHFISFHS